uniref:Titin n=1 Tax=Sinocyclocheilus rhinocerous TaxID=307959 RepID=A0A673GNE0_9TELE
MPLIDGGAKITNYIIEKRESTRKAYAAVITQCDTCSIRVPDLAEGLEYYFRVYAENEYGIGEAVETPDPIRVSQAPTPPENVTFTDVTKNSVSLVWTKPKHDGGSRVTGYVIEAQRKGTDQWAHVTTVKTLDFTVKNLNENEEYIFRVMAVNSSGRSRPRVSKPVVIKEQSSEPEFDLRGVCQKTVIAKAGNDIKVEVPVSGRPKPTLSWQKDNQRDLPAGRWIRANFTNIIETTFTISGLTQDESYEFRLLARNSAGAVSNPSDPSDPIICKDDIEEPRIMVDAKFKDIVLVKAGEVFKLEADVAGQPLPSMVWSKDGKDVENTTKLQIKMTELTAVLINKDSVRRDGGEFILTATNVGGFAKHVFNVKVLDRPGPPKGPLTVSDITAEKCVLTWNPPADDGGANIQHYVIEKRESSRLAWTNVASELPVNQYQVTKLLKGNEYIFRVMAVNKYGVGEPLESEAIIADNPYVRPDPPQTPEITAVTKDSVVLCWGAPASNGGSEITNYRIEKRDRISLRWVKCNKRNVTDLQFKVTALVPGHEYEFRVFAENAAGISEPSPSSPFVKATDTLFKPGPPGNPRILDTTNSSITLAWNKPVYDETSRLLWTVVEPKVQALNLKIMKLLEGNEYIFRVLPVNKFGVGEPLQSSAVVIKNPFTPPDAPKGVEVSNVKKNSMVITWEAPTNDGGTPITGYIIEKHDKEGIRWTRCNMKTVTNLTFKVTGLLENHLYEFRVSAENAAGVSEASSATVFYKALDPVFKPGPPHNPKVLDMTKSSVVLAWGKPIYDGGCEIQGYIVEACEAKTAAADEWTICTQPTGVKLTCFNVENLKEKQEYKFRVCAVNKVGVGEHADVAGSILPEDKTEEPDLDIDAEFRKVVRIKAGGSLRMFIPFKGRPAPQIKWEKDGGQIKETAQTETSSSHTSLVIDKVNRADSGKYTVTAENSAGAKSETIIVKVLDTPSASLNFKVKEITKESVTLTWEPPILDGGAKIKNYIVEKRESTRKTFSAVVTNCHKLSWKVEPLQEGCSYYFRVLAENEHGIGLPADITYPLKVSEVPQCPGKLSVLDVTKTSVSLSWEKPIHDGGSRILQYLVEMQVKGNDKWSGCANVKTLEAVISNLNPGEEYTFRVIAINEKGKSDPRTLAVPVQAKDLVFGPDVRPAFSNYSVLVGKDLQVEIPVSGRPKPKVTWTKDGAALKFTTRVNISNTAHSTVLNIKEAAREDGGMYGINVSNVVGQKDATIEIITLDKPGAKYDFRVIAKNAVGTISKPSYNSGPIAALDEVEPPKFSIDPEYTQTLIVNAGDTFKLDADVYGKPLPAIQWFKNDKELENTIRCDIRNTDNRALIIVKDARDRSGIRWTRCNRKKVTDVCFRVHGLIEDHEYEFRMSAENAAGIGEPSL